MPTTTIGILSDTHLQEPTPQFLAQVSACFAEVSIVCHLGDLTNLRVLQAFAGKTVHAVHGNMCDAITGANLPRKKTVTVGSCRIGMIHRVGKSYDFEAQLWPEFDEVECILYGHTHQPVCHRSGGVLYLNPGSFMAGSRFGAPATYGILTVENNQVRAAIHEVPRL